MIKILLKIKKKNFKFKSSKTIYRNKHINEKNKQNYLGKTYSLNENNEMNHQIINSKIENVSNDQIKKNNNSVYQNNDNLNNSKNINKVSLYIIENVVNETIGEKKSKQSRFSNKSNINYYKNKSSELEMNYNFTKIINSDRFDKNLSVNKTSKNNLNENITSSNKNNNNKKTIFINKEKKSIFCCF